jgi:exportin-7
MHTRWTLWREQLGRLKANYQLSELVRVDGYLEWVELAATFTVKSFQQWQWSTNSIHYLLALWGRLVAAVPYVRPEMGAKNHQQRLQDCVRLVMQCYVKSMVDSVETVLMSEGALDDPLGKRICYRTLQYMV